MKRTALALLLLAAACGKPELHVLNWSDYFAPDTISNFEKEFGCRVTLDYIEASDSVRQKLKDPPSGFDVVFPSDEVMSLLLAGNLLEPLDHSRLKNLGNIEERFRNLPFDPGHKYSVPYMWGTTGIAYNVKQVDPPPDSWAALWDPKYAEHVTFLDDERDVLAAAMLLNGDDPLTPTAESIARARDKLKEAKPRAWTSSTKEMLISGDAWLAQCFNGDALQAGEAEERAGDIGFVIPKEGGFAWLDNMAIAKGAPHLDLAYAFLDYLLRPEVSAAISNEVWYANPNAAARPHIDKELLEDTVAFPDEETMARCRVLTEPPPALKKAWLDAWAEVKAR